MVEEQIRARGVRDERVLAVMQRVPRERFLPPEEAAWAYTDRALPLAGGQTISQPYIVAAMTEALGVQPDHRVLEVGTGSGYQTAVLAELAAEVYTLERLDSLQRAARETLALLGVLNVAYRVGDGTLGWPEAAPFDGIIVAAAAPRVPPSLVRQLRDGGRLVIPVGPEDHQTLTIVERVGDTIREWPQFACRFVKLIGQEGWPA
ncbi:MAG: protein-L-isoaspartate(D-aspartate) O-methyltransferase [Phycisphaerae bacterium]|jgi:protein-L-isoaspartate(D-aspartate) O-methyltransferase